MIGGKRKGREVKMGCGFMRLCYGSMAVCPLWILRNESREFSSIVSMAFALSMLATLSKNHPRFMHAMHAMHDRYQVAVET